MTKKKFLTLAIATAIAGISLVWATTATSSYIHEKIVDWTGTITICDPVSNETKCITMMDKNLWATSDDITSTDSYGYNYQWWNNHWFLPCLDSDWCSTFLWDDTMTTDERVDTFSPILYWPLHYYDSNIFRKITSNPYDWSSPSNDNLWWWSGDSENNTRWYNTGTMSAINVLDRQWPCPTWYHVPSQWEWWTLLQYWVANYTWTTLTTITLNWIYPLQDFSDSTAKTQFKTDFKIPFSTTRSVLAQVWGGQNVYFWTSSPSVASESFGFSMISSKVNAYNSYSRAYSFPIRCFKNNSLIFPLIEPTDSGILVTVWETIYQELTNMEVTTNNEVEIEADEPVVWEVSVDFWEDVSAKFNKLVQVNIPVEDYEDVIVKVKHAWSDEYNFDWLTLNRNASCNDNWRPTSSQYNWEIITVVDWFASIYTCEASSFVALWVRPWEALGEVTLTLTAWENTCTLNDYNLWTHNVSSEDQNVSTSWQDIVCEFLKNPWATIQLSMWDLVDWTKEIWRQYFTWIVTSLWNSLWSIANLTWWSYNFLSSHIIYTKEVNTIWTWTWSLAIEWIIPAWTPSWEYTWELNIIICEGC